MNLIVLLPAVCLKAVTHAQAEITACFGQRGAGTALAVRAVQLVADIVDGEIDMPIVFAGRFPVGINIVYAVAAAVDVAQTGGGVEYGVIRCLDKAAVPADFDIRCGKMVSQAGGPCSADGDGDKQVVDADAAVGFGAAVCHAHAGGQRVFAVSRLEFIAVIVDGSAVIKAAVANGLNVFDNLAEIAAFQSERIVPAVIKADFCVACPFGFQVVIRRIKSACSTAAKGNFRQTGAVAGIVEVGF